MTLANVSLDDKYDLSKSRIFATGYQALVRLCMMQKELDRRAGLNTAGYVSGYRGSPLGGLDQQFMRAKRWLDRYDVKFHSGLNEDLAATALWGTQQAELRGEGRFDGVFGMWYGKGPGVDRSGDALRHANFAGTSRNGGVLALMGDDHTAESSTTAHQSEFNFVDVMIPILNPAGVQEIIDYGIYGWAMSRFTGAWVGLKCMHETVESTAVIDGSLERLNIVIPGPDEYAMPDGGLNIRLGDTVLGMEARVQDFNSPCHRTMRKPPDGSSAALAGLGPAAGTAAQEAQALPARPHFPSRRPADAGHHRVSVSRTPLTPAECRHR